MINVMPNYRLDGYYIHMYVYDRSFYKISHHRNGELCGHNHEFEICSRVNGNACLQICTGERGSKTFVGKHRLNLSNKIVSNGSKVNFLVTVNFLARF